MKLKYQQIPVIIEAIQWTGKNSLEILEWCGAHVHFEHNYLGEKILCLTALESNTVLDIRHSASVGDYVVKNIKGEFNFCKQDVMALKFEWVGADI